MKLIFEQIKKHLIVCLLVVLIGIAIYGIFNIEIKNENYQFQYQNQSQNQSQSTVIINGLVLQGMEFKSVIVNPEICNIKEPSIWFVGRDPDDEELIAYTDCIIYKFENKPFGYSAVPIYKRAGKLPWVLVTYWDYKR